VRKKRQLSLSAPLHIKNSKAAEMPVGAPMIKAPGLIGEKRAEGGDRRTNVQNEISKKSKPASIQGFRATWVGKNRHDKRSHLIKKVRRDNLGSQDGADKEVKVAVGGAM